VLDVRTHGRLLDVNALIDITHSYNNDITISLSHGGTTVLLANRLGGSEGRNYTNTVFDDQAGVAIDAGFAYSPYTGSFRPQEALAAFIGVDVFGLWTLVVTDHEAGDDGSINRFGIDVVLLRFFGGYGPNQNLTWWGGPQSVFIGKALDGEPLPIHGDGRQTRSFTYISDHVAGIAAAVESSAADNLVVNIGAEQEISIRGLAELIWRLVHGEESTPRIEIIPYESFGKYEDVLRRVPDISRARQLLGFEPKVELEPGLRETIRWQDERRRIVP